MKTMCSPIDPETRGTLYVNDRPLIFTENATRYQTTHPETTEYCLLKGADQDNLSDAIRRLEHQTYPGVLIEDKDSKGVQETLSSFFQQIKAAGGLVSEPGGSILMIYRRGKWDLPKGKIDDGETIENAAVREVREETGLPEVRLLNLLCKTRHIYRHKSLYVLKTTYWFTMEVQEAYPLIPQQEEDITIAEWADAERAKAHLRNSFETIRSVFQTAGQLKGRVSGASD